MPVQECTAEGKSGHRWGKHGKCYIGEGSRARAERQGRAIESNKGFPMEDQVLKFHEDRQEVFGWFNVSVSKDGTQIVDLQDDMIDPDELEKAAYDFVLESREGGLFHKGDAQATLIESMVFTPEKLEAMGLAKDAVPARWWGGFKIHDPEVFKQVKDGVVKMFSIEGTAVREEV